MLSKPTVVCTSLSNQLPAPDYPNIRGKPLYLLTQAVELGASGVLRVL